VCEAALFVSLVVCVLYFLPYFIGSHGVSDILAINDLGVVCAGVTALLSFLSYLWPPKKHVLPASTVVYLLLAATASLLVYSTDGTQSPFIALWIVIAVFASVFGLWGVAPLMALPAGYGVYLVVISPELPIGQLVVVVFAGLLPLVASYIIFHTKTRSTPGTDEAYHALASELSQVANKSDVVIKAIDDGVIALNSKGVIELMNPAAGQIIGWGNSDAVGLDYKSVLKLTDSRDKPLDEAVDPVLKVLSINKDEHTKEFYTTTGGGKRIALSLVVSPIGQPGEGVIITFRNITKELAEEREQAEFISTASHEMRTPVASIEGYLGLALNPATATIDAKAREFIEKAHESAQHLGRLFQDLLDVSKADDGRLSNHAVVVDVVNFLADVVEGLRPKAEAKQLRLFYKPQPDGDSVEARNISPLFYAHVDQDHLRELVANLVENAIKYTPEGDVVVDVGGDDAHVKITVQDSGIGIPHEDIPHLFQKFYRVDNSKTREIGGTGLGLYLCRRLAEVMGGRIWVESEFQKGSMFHLELPRLDREQAVRMIDAASAQPGAAQAEPMPTIIHGSAPLLPATEEPEPRAAEPQPAPQPNPEPAPAPTPPAPAPVAPVTPQPVAAPAHRPTASIQIPVRNKL